MKRMIFAAIAAATIAAGAKPLDPKTCTEQEVRTVLAEVLALSNNLHTCGVSNKLWATLGQPRFDAIRLEADDALARRGRGFFWPCFVTWPKTSAIARSENGVATNLPYTISLANKYCCDIDWRMYLTAMTADECARMMAERASHPIYYSMGGLCRDKRSIQRLAAKSIKRKMRERGISFVTKDGVNPVEQYLTRLNAALDAPRFKGLDKWFEELGYAEAVDLSRLPSEEDVAKLREAVMYGERNMVEPVKVCLYVCLGVEGYNAFVKEYNGDK